MSKFIAPLGLALALIAASSHSFAATTQCGTNSDKSSCKEIEPGSSAKIQKNPKKRVGNDQKDAKEIPFAISNEQKNKLCGSSYLQAKSAFEETKDLVPDESKMYALDIMKLNEAKKKNKEIFDAQEAECEQRLKSISTKQELNAEIEKVDKLVAINTVSQAAKASENEVRYKVCGSYLEPAKKKYSDSNNLMLGVGGLWTTDQLEAEKRRRLLQLQHAENACEIDLSKYYAEVTRTNELARRKALPNPKIGMPSNQIEERTNWGKPINVIRVTTKTGVSETWTYDLARSLHFENGKLVMIKE